MTANCEAGSPRSTPSTFARRFGGVVRVFQHTGAVLFVWLGALVLEHLAVGLGWRDYFAGSWEMAIARMVVSPIVLALLVPLAFVACGIGAWARRAATSPAARQSFAALAALAGAATAFSVSTGRHLESVAVRAPFVAIVSAVAGASVYGLLPAAARVERQHPHLVTTVAGALGVAAWVGDGVILPRLYPGFHSALFAVFLLATALCARPIARSNARLPRALAMTMFVFSVECALLVPRAARGLRSVDNLRVVLLEHAPLMGRAVLVAAKIAPPLIEEDEALEAGGGAMGRATPGEVARALDWTGQDVVLLSVDALRADHVGAYGYERGTTPNIDALAKQGVVFESAYCPTPHTSYSVTSMMTGKYMRPLLALGLGEDSDTWAALLRRYDYRTAAFYPPAVFFIDAPRFMRFDQHGLDFEYRKVEFAPAALRASQVAAYLDTLRTLPADRPLFLWVHLFEPHEPYEMHPTHAYGRAGDASALDAYDSEIAAADEGIGAILAKLATRRRKSVVIVTADHGEEFGEHGGRYHGTTVYEEQVRVPLVIAAPGVTPRRVTTPVQTIDLLPTTLSALGIPRPARVRGRDLGPRIAGVGAANDDGIAFAETDDYTLLAKKDLRLVCARKAGACALYEPRNDPREHEDLTTKRPLDAAELRRLTTRVAAEHGRFEHGASPEWPEAIRRGMQGEREAADDVATLLDDARLDVRRKAAEVTFDLHAPSTAPQARRALSSEDPDVRGHVALALARMPQEALPAEAERLLREGDAAWKRKAALALAERDDPRGGAILAAWWTEDGTRLPFDRAKEILAALARTRVRAVVPSLVATLGDVRLRPYVADALGAIGDTSARAPLLETFAREPYLPTRANEARALYMLGARAELREPLARFAGMPEPMYEALRVARAAGLLDPAHGGWVAPDKADGGAGDDAATSVRVTLRAPGRGGAARLLVLTDAPATGPDVVRGTLAGAALVAGTTEGNVTAFEVPSVGQASSVSVELSTPQPKTRLVALWLVAREPELPPPPPEAWDAGGPGDSEPRDGDVDRRVPGK